MLGKRGSRSLLLRFGIVCNDKSKTKPLYLLHVARFPAARVHGTSASRFLVKLAACRCKFCGLLLKSTLNGNVLSKSLLGGVFAHVLGNFDEFRLPANLALR